MSEKRTVVLLNTKTLQEVEVSVKLRELSADETANIDPSEIDAAVVNMSAEDIRDEYEAKTGVSHLVVDIRRGE